MLKVSSKSIGKYLINYKSLSTSRGLVTRSNVTRDASTHPGHSSGPAQINILSFCETALNFTETCWTNLRTQHDASKLHFEETIVLVNSTWNIAEYAVSLWKLLCSSKLFVCYVIYVSIMLILNTKSHFALNYFIFWNYPKKYVIVTCVFNKKCLRQSSFLSFHKS